MYDIFLKYVTINKIEIREKQNKMALGGKHGSIDVRAGFQGSHLGRKTAAEIRI